MAPCYARMTGARRVEGLIVWWVTERDRWKRDAKEGGERKLVERSETDREKRVENIEVLNVRRGRSFVDGTRECAFIKSSQ